MSISYNKNSSSPVNWYEHKGAQSGLKELEKPQGTKGENTPIKPNLTTVAEIVEDIIKRLTEDTKRIL